MGSGIWSRDEHLVALDLYLNHPDIVEDSTDPTVQEAADLLGRESNAVAMRLGNYRYLDPRNTKGLSNISSGCREIWEDYYGNEEELAYEAERARERLRSSDASTDEGATTDEQGIQTGEIRVEGVRRQGQKEFRTAVLERYHGSCLLCDVATQGLLQAGHIVPWSEFEAARGDSENGLLLCYTHHRAFDLGMFTISENHEVLVRPGLSHLGQFLERTLSDREVVEFPGDPPSAEYLRQHNERLKWWPPTD